MLWLSFIVCDMAVSAGQKLETNKTKLVMNLKNMISKELGQYGNKSLFCDRKLKYEL